MFFIVGRGRSGTDLLQRVLNTNSNICIPPETTVPALLYYSYYKKTNWTNKTIQLFCADIYKDDKIPQWWKIQKNDINEFLLKNQPNSYADALTKFYNFYALQENKTDAEIGDKNPSNTLYLKELIHIFPTAKFIVMVRNPVDNVHSFLNVRFDSNNYKVLAHRWNYYNKELLKFIEKYPDKFKLIQFEELVSNTTQILSEIAAFLNLKDEFNLEEATGGDKEWQKNLGKKISRNHIGKGQKNLTKQEILNIESICFETATKIGYNQKTPKSKLNINPYAWFFNKMEKHIIKIPLSLSTSILKLYRKKSKIIE